MLHPTLSRSALLGASLLACTAVSAAPVTLQVCSGASCWNGAYQITDGVVVDWSNVEALPNGNGNSVNDWVANTGNGLELSDWTLSMDSDPFVTNNFTITNATGSTQTYTLGTTIGVTPAIPNGVMKGSIGFSLTDNNGNGATLTTTTGTAIYQGMIDGNPARTLWDSPTTFTTPFGSTAGSTYFGFPVAETAPESIDTNIGILITFTLTAGDSAAFSSHFEVTPVPVPAAVWLLGSGLLGLLGVARRRSV